MSAPEIRDMHREMFRDLELQLPGNISPGDYATGPLYGVDDIHFNDSGHAGFAIFLDSLITLHRSGKNSAKGVFRE